MATYFFKRHKASLDKGRVGILSLGILGILLNNSHGSARQILFCEIQFDFPNLGHLLPGCPFDGVVLLTKPIPLILSAPEEAISATNINKFKANGEAVLLPEQQGVVVFSRRDSLVDGKQVSVAQLLRAQHEKTRSARRGIRVSTALHNHQAFERPGCRVQMFRQFQHSVEGERNARRH